MRPAPCAAVAAGPYRVFIPAHRTLHLRFNSLQDPEPIPRDTDYSRQSANALLTTMAFPGEQ